MNRKTQTINYFVFAIQIQTGFASHPATTHWSISEQWKARQLYLYSFFCIWYSRVTSRTTDLNTSPGSIRFASLAHELDMSRDLQQRTTEKKILYAKMFCFWFNNIPSNTEYIVHKSVGVVCCCCCCHGVITSGVCKPKRHRIKMKIIFTLFIIQMA